MRVPTSALTAIIAAAACAAASAGVAAGQELEDFEVPEGSAVLIGLAIDSTTGQPLEGAAIYIVESDASAVTDSLGRFALGPIGVGLYRISFFHGRLGELGVSAAPMFLVDLTDGGLVRADLYVPRGEELETLQRQDLPDVEPIMLDAIEVVAEREIDRREQRERSGATIPTLEREQIAQRVEEARHIGDLLSGFPSLRISSPGGGILCVESRRSAPLRTSRGGQCRAPVAVYLDGVPLADPEFTLLQIRPRDVQRVEFLNAIIAGARYGRNAGNGVLVIETRRPR